MTNRDAQVAIDHRLALTVLRGYHAGLVRRAVEVRGGLVRFAPWAADIQPMQQQVTRVTDIRVQVGKSGQLTPVAILEPVHLSGTTVSRASLHNFDELERKYVRVGDHVLVQKAGEIIPQVVKTMVGMRTGVEYKLKRPRRCPSCSDPVEKDEDGVCIRCVNPLCSAQQVERIIHFGGRNAMDIEGLGEALVNQLVSKKLVRDYGDIYYLSKADVASLERMADKSAQNLLDGIEASKQRGLSRLLFALGIPHVGAHIAAVLARNYESLDRLMEASEEQLQQIPEIGPKVAASICDFLKRDQIRHVLRKLIDAGVSTRSHVEVRENPYVAGKTFVVTGTLKNHQRAEMEELIRSLGGRAASGVSRKTDYVIAGDSPGSKLEKARQLGVPVMTEEEFERRLRRREAGHLSRK